MDEIVASQLAGVPVAALAFLFLYAGTSKFFHLKPFRTSLLFIPYFPAPLASPVALLVPILEVFAGVGLLSGTWWGVALSVSLLVATSLVATIAHFRKQRVPCVCFAPSATEHLSVSTAARNAMYACIATIPALVPSLDIQPLVMAYGVATLLLYLCLHAAMRNRSEIEIGRSL